MRRHPGRSAVDVAQAPDDGRGEVVRRLQGDVVAHPIQEHRTDVPPHHLPHRRRGDLADGAPDGQDGDLDGPVRGEAGDLRPLGEDGPVDAGSTAPAPAEDAGDAGRTPLRVTPRGREMTAIGAARFDELRARWARRLEPGELDTVEKALALLAAEQPRAPLG